MVVVVVVLTLLVVVVVRCGGSHSRLDTSGGGSRCGERKCDVVAVKVQVVVMVTILLSPTYHRSFHHP